MTFKDLRRRLGNLEGNNNIENSTRRNNNDNAELVLRRKQYDIFRNKPFWIENIQAHRAEDKRTKGNCCFNHIIGLPKKDGIEHKIYYSPITSP